MKIKLTKTPKNVTIIEGFPGFGLVATIATEYLLDHLKTEYIGNVLFDELPAMVAVHNGKVMHPMGIFYNKEFNLVIFHVITAATGVEWKMAEAVLQVADRLKAKEIISLEGIGSQKEVENPRIFYHASEHSTAKKLEEEKLQVLKEGIIVGVTSALILNSHIPMTCFFSETHSNMPDSKAAANVIKTLDGYLGLKVDPEPLLKTAEKFEGQLQELFAKSQGALSAQEKKKLTYVG